MKLLFQFLLVLCSLNVLAQQQVSLIPMPNKLTVHKGNFLLSPKTIIVADRQLEQLSWQLSNEILKRSNLSLSRYEQSNQTGIYLLLNSRESTSDTDESYKLEVKNDKIIISAATKHGLFNGISTFLQLLNAAKTENGSRLIPELTINDRPLLEWRGIMLDESRYFYGKEKVKSILDWMAFYKLNRFHWHLTDEPGWRLSINKYPRLTLVGGIGNYLDPNAPAQYYTQEEIREIVRYAAERFITVIPEIDMPGHATAANLAYPEYSGGGSKAHPEFTFNPGKESTYQYLNNIVKEANVMFPAGLIHLGGDEVSYGNEKWKTDADIASLKVKENLADEKAVERYFMKRMADSVYQLNAKVLVWDEMADAGLPNDQTIIFWWRHDKPEQLKIALNNNYKTVLCPRLPLYFDFVQDSTHQYGRKWDKLYNPIKQVYDFDPFGLTDNGEQKAHILGIQANLWTETVPTTTRLDYLLFPRIAALAETAWTNHDQKDNERFMKNLKSHLTWYKQAGLYYYDPFNPLLHPEPVAGRKQALSEKD